MQLRSDACMHFTTDSGNIFHVWQTGSKSFFGILCTKSTPYNNIKLTTESEIQLILTFFVVMLILNYRNIIRRVRVKA